MNLAALLDKSRALKRSWRVATREDGASPQNHGRGDGEVVEGETATWEEPGDCPRAGPATGETSLPEAKEEQLVSYAQPATHEPSPEHGGSERMMERRTDPNRHTEKRTHPVTRLPDPEEEKHTGADDESVPWQTDLPEETPTPGRLSCKFWDR
ncbi:hypothetical protein E2C01_018006 [Portunus trituberculatus]|uniref:Uncharacterized protein n=1 Tax=Portunus trituberculatus TaxID=210409 RepID=A0A5B7DTE1_PORTR|nr:hypothetical protein [Portunus trituberculatus]